MRPGTGERPPLIPQPSELTFGSDGAAFTLDAATLLQLGSAAGSASLFSARELQAAIQDASGITPSIQKTEGHRAIALLVDDAVEHGTEGYQLQVTPRGVTIAASTETGLFYGVQTFKQLLKTYGVRIPALQIRDRPVLAHRGVMLDVSRGKVPTLATLFALVAGLSTYKYNQLQLYTEHTFHFPSHPDIGARTDPLTAEDILVLDDYCRERHVELVPNLQSFGHLRHMLSMPQYRHLDEVGWRWSLTPAHEETYRLLDDLYSDLLPAFGSRWLNVDCDETWDLGTGQSKALAAEVGKGRVYLQHILRLRELAGKHGRRIMLWADMLHHYPDLMSSLPDDVLLLDWAYEAADEYSTTEALKRSGRPFWVCPGTSSWNTLFPRLDNALDNIRNFVRDGLRAGASGMLLTDWGDYGHYQPLSLSWYAYLFGAATAWSGAQTSLEEFDAAFASQFLDRPPGDRSVSAMRRLGRAVTAPTLGLRNRSNLAVALFEDPLKGRLTAEIEAASVAEAEAAATDAIPAWAALPSVELRHDLSFTARLVAFAARKVLLAQRLQTTLRAAHHDVDESGRAEALSWLDKDIAELQSDRALVPALRAEFESVWLRHARRSEIHKTLDHFNALQDAYDSALRWLHDQRARYADGGGIDTELITYTPPPLVILWEQGLVELRKLADAAGIEALPENIRQRVIQSKPRLA